MTPQRPLPPVTDPTYGAVLAERIAMFKDCRPVTAHPDYDPDADTGIESLHEVEQAYERPGTGNDGFLWSV